MKNKEKLEENLLHFLNFIDTFGYGSSNDNSHFKHEKSSGTYECYSYRNLIIDTIIDNIKDGYCKVSNVEERKISFTMSIRNKCLSMLHYLLYFLNLGEVIALIMLE